MKVSRIPTQSTCKLCGGSIAFKLDRSLTKDIIAIFISNGFKEYPHFTKAGILYVENEGIMAQGTFGSTTIQTKCKKKDCDNFLNDFEHLLTNF